MVKQKDVALAIFAAATGLGGLVLVFLGLVVSTRQSFPGDTPKTTLDPFQNASKAGLVAFGIALGSVVFALVWLLAGIGFFYIAAIVLFFVTLLAIIGLAVYVIFKTMS